MRPNDRLIRDLLRKDAAQAPIPTDMWHNISRRLNQDAARAKRRRSGFGRSLQANQLLGLVAAAALFLLTLTPAGPLRESMGNAPVSPDQALTYPPDFLQKRAPATLATADGAGITPAGGLRSSNGSGNMAIYPR